jgi:AraC-like DNA-binding protein
VQTVRHESEFGVWEYVTRAPDPGVAPLMFRELIGFRQERASFASWLEAPRPALTMMIDLEGSICADGAKLPGAWLAGLGDGYTVVEFEGSYASVDVELTPFGAYQVLGRPLSELAGQVVALDDLFGAAGGELATRLREAPGWSARFDELESFLLGRAAQAPVPSPAIQWAWERMCDSHGQVRIDALAGEIGCSRRYLHAAFSEQIGLAPKAAARLLRFRNVCLALGSQPARWADIALEAGYCDQSHLNRDFRELAGTTPSDFLARQIPGGGVVGDEIPFVQDEAPSVDLG